MTKTEAKLERARKAHDLKIEKMRLAKIFGERMAAARELSYLSQRDAAIKLGYANSGRLSKIEKSSDTLNVPLYVVVRAARLYKVSIDYLVGESDDWEPETPRDGHQFVVDMLEKIAKRDMVVMGKLEEKMRLVTPAIEFQAQASKEAFDALNSFCAMHPEIEDMRASRLISTINKSYRAGLNAKAQLHRYTLECRAHSLNSNQLTLSLEEESEREAG